MLLALFAGHASANNPVIDGEPQDFWFTYTEPAVLTLRTYAVEGFQSDPMLWVYDSQGVMLASNDDWFGLQSFIELPVQAGSYRVRAGWCCNDPNATRPGWRYELGSSASPVFTTVETSTSLQEPTTTIVDTTSVSTTTMQETSTTTTSSVPESTTTQEPTTTTQNVAPPTTDPVPSTSDQPTTTQTPTTLQESTTTSDETSTTLPVSEPIPTDPVSETILTTTTQEPTTTTIKVTTTLTTLPPKPQATTPPQTSTTTPTLPPVTSTSSIPLTTAPPETLETTTTTAPNETLPNILTTPDAIADAVAQADTPAERANLTAQLNVAPDDTKRTFEATINVYNGQWDNYVPAGSRIPVGERRTLIAVMGGLVSLASTAPRRKN